MSFNGVTNGTLITSVDSMIATEVQRETSERSN
jgi:hypothetical protein